MTFVADAKTHFTCRYIKLGSRRGSGPDIFIAALPVLTNDVGLVFGQLAKPGFGAVGPSDFD